MNEAEKEARLYRLLSLLVGTVYLVWWLAVEAILPGAFNPFLSRFAVVLFIWGVAAASYLSPWVLRHLRSLWVCGLWLITAHYHYLFYMNAGDINWIVGSFITVTAVSLGILSRASMLTYTVFVVALALGLVAASPALAKSVFLPGLFTILLQANIGLLSRLGIIRDLANSKAALRRSNEALERSNVDLQRFAYVASHDLQTPLRSIASFVDLLQSTYADKIDDQGKDWLRRTSQSVTQLQALIQDLLDYSRIDARVQPFERIALRDVVERATSLLDAVVVESEARITHDELPEVMGDRSLLVQLMLNLLGNAIKYRGADAPSIHVAAESKDDAWLLAVRDNGIGIAPKHHEQVFEVFKRLHDAKTYPGTGIGLAVCRRVVNRHGGKIWVESELGKGCVFYFTITKGARP